MSVQELSLPQAIDAEKTILGVLLMDNDRFHECVELEPYMFSLDSHRRIYKFISESIEREEAVDYVTISTRMSSEELQAIGGIAYVSSLTEGVPRRAAIMAYIRGVKETYKRRRIITSCYEASQRAEDKQESMATLSFLQGEIESILDSDRGDDPLVVNYIKDTLDKIIRERNSEEELGLSYGVPAVDAFTCGMMPGEVTVVGARSGVGKTSLMCQATVPNCEANIPCDLFSLEMTRDRILRILISIVSGVDTKKLRNTKLLNIHELQKVMEAGEKISSWPLRIHDKSEMTLSEVVALARVSMRKHGSRFIAVDYAQEIDSAGKDERTKVMMTARKLARMVKHENCHLMLLSQLTKTSRENYSKPPIVGDLVESGKLENIAHVVMLLHRPWDDETGMISTKAEIIIPKQREGSTGVIQAKFNIHNRTFEAYS